jgi:Secretion system C-terminal sorting domain
MSKFSFAILAAGLLILPQTTNAQGFLHFFEPEQFESSLQNDWVEGAGGYLFSQEQPYNGGVYALQRKVTFDGLLNNELSIVENTLPLPGEGSHVQFLANGDILTTEVIEADTVIRFQRLPPNQDVIWTQQVSLGESNEALAYLSIGTGLRAPEVDQNGDFYLYGFFEAAPDNTRDVFLMKLSADGQLLWQRTIDRTLYYLEDYFQCVMRPMANGDCAVFTYTADNGFGGNFDYTGQLQIVHPDGSAELPVTFTSPYFTFNQLYQKIIDDNYAASHGYYMTADESNFVVSNIRLRTLALDGSVAAEANLSDIFQQVIPTHIWSFNHILRLSDGNYLVWAVAQLETQPNLVDRQLALLKITPSGNVVWAVDMDRLENPFFCNVVEMVELSDGGIGVSGFWQYSSSSNVSGTFLLKLDSLGKYAPHQVAGEVLVDLNSSCTADTLETPLPNWLVQVTHLDETWYTSTDALGQYGTAVDSGTYNLALIPPNNLWSVCDNPQTLNIPIGIPATTFPIDFAVQAAVLCPLMKIEIGAPALYANSTTQYIANYCNEGTAAAENTVLTLLPDPALDLLSASAPYQNTPAGIVFELGTVAPGQCAQISLFFDTDDSQIGQTLCVEAQITPNELCSPEPSLWSGASLELRGYCDNDSIRFEIKNVGNMPSMANLDYIIADDHVVMLTGQLPSIAAGGSWFVVVEASGQASYLQVEQEPNRPESRNPSLLAGCSQFDLISPIEVPMQTGSAFSDIECRLVESTASDMYFSQVAYPVGTPPQNTIGQSTKLDYWLNFNLPLAVTTLTIADTLPLEYLDMSSFQLGAATQPFQWYISAAGVLYLEVSDTLAFNQGFVMWSATTRAGLDTGTVIYNRATLNAGTLPSQTANTVFHTIGQAFVSSTTNQFTTTLSQVYPNPASERTQVSVPVAIQGLAQLRLYNSIGQVVQQQKVTGTQFDLHRNGLSAGWYSFDITDTNGRVACGHLIWQ